MDSLLDMLSTTDYISGERLCERLQMTRGAVWKRMEKLRAQGYQIVSAGKLGYRLSPEDNALLPGYLEKELETRWAGRGEVFYEPETTSTNTRAKEMARAGAPHGSLSVCDHQTAGKGRLGRAWETPAGEALTQSMVLRPKLSVEQAQLVTIAAAVATAQAIADLCPTLSPGIKWPNDVLVDGKKCVGILCELAADMDGIQFLVAGVGINVNQTAFDGELSEKATSLLLELRRSNAGAKPLCRRKLLCAYLRHMEDAVDALEQGGLSAIRHSYVSHSVTIGSHVRVIGVNTDFSGIARDIDETGALLAEDESGTLRRVLAADVSVRGMMGYTK